MQPFQHPIKGPVFDYNNFLTWTRSQIEKVPENERRAPQYFEYMPLNLRRMERLEKTTVMSDDLKAAISSSPPVQLWAITEAWCGDSAQSLPVFAIMTEASNVSLNIIFRDDNPDIMDHYLTNGSRSIPVVVAFDAKGNELWHWGPRPVPAQSMYTADKAAGKPWVERDRALHTWYTRDKTHTLQQELVSLLKQANI